MGACVKGNFSSNINSIDQLFAEIERTYSGHDQWKSCDWTSSEAPSWKGWVAMKFHSTRSFAWFLYSRLAEIEHNFPLRS